MSEFDEEAEREKLREKYEKEEQEREATEQMSELLLKGATMTNAHCSDCGDPIFRYDDQEFCPTCEKPVDRGGEDGSGAAGPDDVEVTTPSDDARVRFGGDPTDEESAEEAGTEPDESRMESSTAGETPSDRADPTTLADAAEGTRRVPSPDPATSTNEARSTPDPSTHPTTTNTDADTADVGDSIAAARASLARSAARFARAAEETDDPTVAREHLQAAREAAAALDELD